MDRAGVSSVFHSHHHLLLDETFSGRNTVLSILCAISQPLCVINVEWSKIPLYSDLHPGEKRADVSTSLFSFVRVLRLINVSTYLTGFCYLVKCTVRCLRLPVPVNIDLPWKSWSKPLCAIHNYIRLDKTGIVLSYNKQWASRKQRYVGKKYF